ncbi:hydroxyacid dehydrogenase [Variovorax paradoxus]|jgi:(S)-sulfolactate dehydrogenase|uniref:hydroxyacid dehydrogenase n=1 Tax=Variovorax paradoxus TaxID=34073 RepID=UPI0029C621C5|nr:hydroxyacid dehydrogenase [Variovorax paradoxus]WPH23075.1 hydroxyacid dehydrogenase [Variovorax paradoxus]
MKIVIPELIHPQALERLRAEHDVVFDPTLFTRRSELLAAAQDAHALIVRNRTQVRDDLLEALGKCRAVGRLGVGLDNIDVPGCRARSIEVIPALGANARSVAEYVVTCAMLLLRYSHYSVGSALAEGRWTRPAKPEGHEVAGRTLGLIGFGSIGQVTGHLASRLDMRVVAHDPSFRTQAMYDFECQMLPLDALLATSDVVSLHLPLMPETRGLINADRLAMMQPGAVLINAARGGIVDEAALAHALSEGRLRAAALDVFEDEPLPSGSVLAGAPNLLLTPHVAGVTADSELRVGELVAERILALLKTI